MTKFMFFLLTVCLFFGAGAQVASDSILVDGNYRVFHFKKPLSITKGSSLVFVLHGSGGNGLGARNGALKLEEKSASEHLLLVYPDGYKKFWNECRKSATSAANLENIDESAFFDMMILYFTERYKVDPSKVFAIGTSGGGHMAYKLALTDTKKYKAITAVIANLPDSSNLDCAGTGLPIAVMIINGTSDSTNPYNGGEVKIPGTNFGRVRSTEKTFQYWANLDGYSGEPIKEDLPDTDPTDGKTIERYFYKAKKKPTVVLLKVINGKHDYPNDINVYLEAWAFFKTEMKR